MPSSSQQYWVFLHEHFSNAHCETWCCPSVCPSSSPSTHYGNQSRGCLMGGEDPYDHPLCPGLQPGPPSQTPGGLGQNCWSVIEVTWPPNLVRPPTPPPTHPQPDGLCNISWKKITQKMYIRILAFLGSYEDWLQFKSLCPSDAILCHWSW